MPDHRGQTYDPDERPPRGVMGWAKATPAVRVIAVVVFMAGSAVAGAAFYKPANPKPKDSMSGYKSVRTGSGSWRV